MHAWMTRSPSLRWASRCAIALVATAAVGCKRPTAILVTVDTNIPTGRPLELTARIAESDEGAISGNQLWSRGVSVRRDTLAFPASFTIRPKAGDSRGGTVTVWLDVNALPWPASMDTMRFTKKLRVAFTPGQIVRVPVFLAAECGARATDCPPDNPSCTLADQCEARGLSCGAGGQCEPLLATTVPLDDYDAQFAPLDSASAMDAGLSSDAAINDGSAMDTSAPSDACAPSCAGRECGSDNCGGSCGSCAAHPNMVPTCSASGRCEYTCATGFGDCDAMSANGCETALNSSTNCGMCGRACTGMTPNCVAGVCDSGCGSLSRCANACVDLSSSESNCGSCGNVCSFANATAVCVMGACAISACNAGFGNCDGIASNGCEVDTRTSLAHCGMCGRACTNTGEMCVSGACQCPAGQAVCGTTCAAAPGTACTRTCFTGATWSCNAGSLTCTGGTMSPDGTPCGAGGRVCNSGTCTCPAGTCFRCGMCQGCTGVCV